MSDPTLEEFKKNIRRVVKNAGVKSKKVAEATRAWIATQPESILQHTRIATVMKGSVIVEVDSHALLHELQGFRKQEALEALKIESQVAVSDLQFKIFRNKTSPEHRKE